MSSALATTGQLMWPRKPAGSGQVSPRPSSRRRRL